MASYETSNFSPSSGLALSPSTSISPRITLRISGRHSDGSPSTSQAGTPKNLTPRSSANIDTCIHENAIHGICPECGLCLGGASSGTHMDMNMEFTQSHQYSGSVEAAYFEKDVKGLNIPETVKALVVEMAATNDQEIHRMGVRRQQLFSYIYLAYLRLGMAFDPTNVSNELKMNQREVNLAVRMISATSSVNIPLPRENNNVVTAPIVVLSPINYIEDVCMRNGLQNHVNHVKEVAQRVLKASSSLLEQKPTHIAVAIVKYYMQINSITTIKNFAQFNGLSQATLKQKVAEVAAVDNSS
jgi:hypothetical protein